MVVQSVREQSWPEWSAYGRATKSRYKERRPVRTLKKAFSRDRVRMTSCRPTPLWPARVEEFHRMKHSTHARYSSSGVGLAGFDAPAVCPDSQRRASPGPL